MSAVNKLYDSVDNVYAKNSEGNVIHISVAKSGRGYYCMGCDKEMQAVKQSIEGRLSFFRHHHVPGDQINKCTFSDETYRHQLAKQILQLNKFVKVPSLYKFPPKGSSGLKFLIQESHIITAERVLIETEVYEDENGIIKIGNSSAGENRFLIVKPDVIFLDNRGLPLLFIEIKATSKVDEDKRVKLARLGIDTIQISVPKASPAEIEGCLKNTNRTIWIYNYEESNTEYLSLSDRNGEGILPIDENQRKFFEESYRCRKSQLNNLIRRIKKCLDSQYYNNIVSAFREELSRVEANSEEHHGRWAGIQAQFRGEVEEGLKEQIDTVEQGERENRSKDSEQERKYKELEQRYYAKRKSLETEEGYVDSELSGEITVTGGSGRTIEDRRNRNTREKGTLERNIQIELEESERIREEEGTIPEWDNRKRTKLDRDFEERTESEKRDIELFEREKERMSEQLELDKEALSREFESAKEGLRTEFETLRDQTLERINRKDISGASELSTKLKGILDTGAILDDIYKKEITYRRYRKAWEAFRTGTYENWKE